MRISKKTGKKAAYCENDRWRTSESSYRREIMFVNLERAFLNESDK